MEMKGEFRIAASREKVWDALNDPDVLRQCIPGCEELEKTSDTEFTAKVKTKIGPVSARFAGEVRLEVVRERARVELALTPRELVAAR